MGGQSLSQKQLSNFSDRIRRIERGGPNTSGTIYAGIDEAQHRKRKRKKKRTDGAPLIAQLFMVPFALVLGAGSMLAGRAAAYHAMITPEFIPPERAEIFSLTGDIGIAVAVATFFVLLFALGRGARLIAFMIGFLGVMLGESFIISKVPEPFASVFSPEYVQTAIAKAPADPFSPEALGL